MRYCPLFSGSSGNCAYISSENGSGASGGTGILVDAGVSARRVELALRRRGVEPHSVAAIVVTHEHGDHIAGVEVFARKFGCTVVATQGTLSAMRNAWAALETLAMLPGDVLDVEGIQVSLFSTPHDSRESAGVCVQTPDGRRMAVATDMGEITPEVHAALLGCDLVQLEANHDVDMLTRGQYPAHLKRRILGGRGHLSNIACAEELVHLVREGTGRVVLAHLSRENNTPALAFETVRGMLEHAGLREGQAYQLAVAMQEDVHPVLAL